MARLRELAPDCVPIVAYGALIRREALDIPPFGWINLHFSVLPAWRGAAPVQRAIMAGDEVTGATVFSLVEELDAGPVLGTITELIRPDDTTAELLERLADWGSKLLVDVVDHIEDGDIAAVPQPEDNISYAPKLTTDEARIDWNRPAFAIDRHIRGCTPAPGAWTSPGGATGSRSGPPTVSRRAHPRAGPHRGRQEARCESAPPPPTWSSATSRPSARSACPPPTGAAAPPSNRSPRSHERSRTVRRLPRAASSLRAGRLRQPDPADDARRAPHRGTRRRVRDRAGARHAAPPGHLRRDHRPGRQQGRRLDRPAGAATRCGSAPTSCSACGCRPTRRCRRRSTSCAARSATSRSRFANALLRKIGQKDLDGWIAIVTEGLEGHRGPRGPQLSPGLDRRGAAPGARRSRSADRQAAGRRQRPAARDAGGPSRPVQARAAARHPGTAVAVRPHHRRGRRPRRHRRGA